jgi:hypothetical protein
MTFNQWMAHIHRELGYPENKIKEYEKDRRRQVIIQDNQQGTNGDRGIAIIRKEKNYRIAEGN